MEFQSGKVYSLGLIQKPLHSKYRECTSKNAHLLRSLTHVMFQKQNLMVQVFYFWHFRNLYFSQYTSCVFCSDLPSTRNIPCLNMEFLLKVTAVKMSTVQLTSAAQLCCIFLRISSSAASRSLKSCLSRLIFSSRIVSSKSGGVKGKASFLKEPSRTEGSSSEDTKTGMLGYVTSLY